MNYETFLAKLRETPRDWLVGPNGQIRIVRPMLVADVISAAVDAPAVWNMAHTQMLAERMGLDEPTWKAITRAGDGLPGYDSQIRADLLVACGLSQPPDPLVTRATEGT
jgi:hypothetical protein